MERGTQVETGITITLCAKGFGPMFLESIKCIPILPGTNDGTLQIARLRPIIGWSHGGLDGLDGHCLRTP